MSLEQSIVDWAATRPPWQRAVLQRMATGQVLSDAEFDELLSSALGGPDPSDADLQVAHLPHSIAGDPPVELISITDPEHVNALASDSPLSFGTPGITLVYGDNGSGKSGYARLLKRIARARHNEEILSDVFRDPSVARPKASLTYTNGGVESTIAWPEQDPSELRRILFYDSACGSAYLTSESDFPYRPSALSIFDGLIDACHALRERIEARLEENDQEAQALPAVPEDLASSLIGQYLNRLSARSSIQELNKMLEAPEGPGPTVDDLRRQEARLLTSDTSAERQRLARQDSKLASLLTHLKKLKTEIGPQKLAEIEEIRAELVSVQAAADLMTRSFEAEPVRGVGSSPWKELWESARRFSQSHAYAGEPFPVVKEDSLCVLCQQGLNKDARIRLTRFEEFVREDTQARLRLVTGQWNAAITRVDMLSTTPEAVRSNLTDLEPDHQRLVDSVTTLLAEYETVRATVVSRAMAMAPFEPKELHDTQVLRAVEEARSAVRRITEALDDPELHRIRIGAIARDRRELELIQQARGKRQEIMKEIARLEARNTLELAKSQCGTAPITRKVVEFSEQSVTEVVRDAFTRESDRLRLERVTLRTRGERGTLLHQPTLVGARQPVTLPRVFSEGERTALGLSGFFTEAQLDESNSAIVLDDPVTSLDHVRRALVATRLAEFARSRQVIVFTHDIGFVADVKRQAGGFEVPVAERSISRTRGVDRRPGRCAEGHPWKAKDVKERLGDLRTELALLKKAEAELDEAAYGEVVASFAGRLSETWERILSQEIVGQVLQEGGLEVRPNMVKILVRLTEADGAEFQASYSRISQWARRHDKSPLINYVPPELDELGKEVELVAAWAKRVKGYKN